MKKLGFLLFLILFSCSQEENTLTDENSYLKNKTNSYLSLGQIHNDFMNYVNEDFIPNTKITKKEEAFDYVLSFYNEKIEYYPILNEETKSNLSQEFKDNIFLLESMELQSIIKNEKSIDNSIKEEKSSLKTLLKDLNNEEVISNDEFVKLIDFQNTLSKVFDGEINLKELQDYTEELKKSYNPKESTINNMIEIMDFSTEWWSTKNPDGFVPGIGVITPTDPGYSNYTVMWIANDVAGALIGAGASAGLQYFINGEVDWTIVGGSAVVGAVIGSTGAVGKLGGWIRGLF